MSSIVNKIKEAVLPDKHHTHTENSSLNQPRTVGDRPHGENASYATGENYTAGPHRSDMANKLDPRVDSDRDGSKTLGGNEGSYGTSSYTAGPHRSDAANKLDPRVDSDRDGSNTLGRTENTYGTASHTAGPHRSDAANKLDPRVDSDRDGSRTLGENTSNRDPTFGQMPLGHTGAHHTGAHHTAGPHRSDAANKLDPRIDSDRDGSHALGGNANRDPTFGQMPLGHTGAHHTAGPHRSDAANKLDPRVDSDRDGSNTLGRTENTYGTASHTAGPHRSDAANKLDPRVDSDRDGSYAMGDNRNTTFGQHSNTAATGFGTGPAPNTAGPHRSDMANKLDPRVDSDRDGSKTLGRDQTYSQSGAGLNPRDAADVPPSVLRKHVGEVSIEHDDHAHQRERRHSKASAQDQFRGV